MTAAFSFAALSAIAVGAVAGALLRYAVVVLTLQLFGRQFPWGTLLVNLGGCLLAGLLLAFSARPASPLSDGWRLLLVVGFLGSLTTFSAFSADTLLLLKEAAWQAALVNVLANVLGALLMVTLGFALGQMLAWR